MIRNNVSVSLKKTDWKFIFDKKIKLICYSEKLIIQSVRFSWKISFVKKTHFYTRSKTKTIVYIQSMIILIMSHYFTIKYIYLRVTVLSIFACISKGLNHFFHLDFSQSAFEKSRLKNDSDSVIYRQNLIKQLPPSPYFIRMLCGHSPWN